MSIKKILCPVDFSNASNNGVEYAAKLSIKTGSELTLMHILSLPAIYEDVTTFGLLSTYNEKRKEAQAELKDYCNEIISAYNVPCSYDIEYSGIEKSSGKIENENYDLIVCGSNGADNISQFYLGSDSFRISRNSEAPTLIVPELCSYSEINHLVFASGYNKGDHVLVKQLKDFMKDFNSSLTVLHISEKETPVSQEVFRAFTHIVDEAMDFHQKINFQRVVNKDEAESIEHFMHESNADVLAVCMEEHGFLYRMFHTNLIKKITSYADYPVLIFHK
jgi:nucleotide-binding universal stress UspA family protein